MDINTLLCNDETKNDNDVEMKDSNNQSSSINKILPELQSQGSNYETTNPILYSTASSSNVTSNTNNDEMPNMNSLTINSPTSEPLTTTPQQSNIIGSKLDSLSGIAAMTAALRQRKLVRSSPRARKSVLSGSSSPGSNHYPYTTTVGSSRHRLLVPVTPPPNHPLSTAILHRNRIHNGIKNVVRGVSDTFFTHNNVQQNNDSNRTSHNIFNNINNLCLSRNSQASSSSSAPSNSQNQQDQQDQQDQGQQSAPEANLNQDDVNHGIKCCVQWLKYAISHLDQEINLLRNIANESFHVYCNNVQNRRNAHTETSNNTNNNENNSNQNLDSSNSSTSENTTNHNNYQPVDSNQINHYHRKSLIEIKRDIVFTLKRTVEIIIKGASKYLPDESRLVIRRFILTLPSRLSNLRQRIRAPESTENNTDNTATTSNNPNDKLMDTDDDIDGQSSSSQLTEPLNDHEEKENSLNNIQSDKEESLKIMTLATEGNDMLKKMMDVFEKSFQENSKNNLNNVNLINTNESSSLNYNTNKMLYNQNNNKYNKINNNSIPNFDDTTNSSPPTNTNSITTNNNFVINNSMNYENSNYSNN